MRIILSNSLLLEGVPGLLGEGLTKRLTFNNPIWIENERMRRWNGRTPRMLEFYQEDLDGDVIIPRGFIGQLINLCKRYGVRYQLEDRRRLLPEVVFDFNGHLRPFQEDAVEEILKRDFGTLSAPTGSGKTIIALYTIGQRRQPALIVVHTKELLNQWIHRIETFLGIPAEEVGVIGGGKHIVGERVTVALVQSLYKCADVVAPHIGHLVVDECHRAPSRTFTEAVTAFDCRHMLGLSATPWRRDGLSRLIFWHVGDVVHEIEKEDLLKSGDLLPAEVVIRETDFRSSFDPSEEYSRMVSELTQNQERNLLIAGDVAKVARNDEGVCLVLSDRKAQCEAIQGLLRGYGVSSELLTGEVSKREREAVVDRLDKGLVKVLIATGQLMGEGFDAKELSTLFLITPIRFDGRVMQYLGRVLRPAPGKSKARVFDYVDSNIGVLVAAARARERVFETINHGHKKGTQL